MVLGTARIDGRNTAARALDKRARMLSGRPAKVCDSVLATRAAFLVLWCESEEAKALQSGELSDPTGYFEAVKTLTVLLSEVKEQSNAK